MPLRNRNGKLEWRFKVAGHVYSHITGLADTERNRVTAMRLEADARKKVIDGDAAELTIRPTPFISAAEQFSKWADEEYRQHPNSAKRLRVSMTSAKAFFGERPVVSITTGHLELYKSARWADKIKDVTLRHDLHALSRFFRYAIKMGWCRRNPIKEIKIPSDAQAQRDWVLNSDEEQRLFAAIEAMMAANQKRTRMLTGLRDVRDLSLLMLNQGCRPEELRELAQSLVDLENGALTIAKGKSAAARRMLPMTEASRFILSARLMEPGRWVFPARRGAGHMGQHQRLWKSITEQAKLEGLVMYDLRHTFATRAIERGVGLPELAAILGHANLRSVMRYVHMRQGHINRGMEAFERGESLSTFCPPGIGKTRENSVSFGKSGENLNASKIN